MKNISLGRRHVIALLLPRAMHCGTVLNSLFLIPGTELRNVRRRSAQLYGNYEPASNLRCRLYPRTAVTVLSTWPPGPLCELRSSIFALVIPRSPSSLTGYASLPKAAMNVWRRSCKLHQTPGGFTACRPRHRHRCHWFGPSGITLSSKGCAGSFPRERNDLN